MDKSLISARMQQDQIQGSHVLEGYGIYLRNISAMVWHSSLRGGRGEEAEEEAPSSPLLNALSGGISIIQSSQVRAPRSLRNEAAPGSPQPQTLEGSEPSAERKTGQLIKSVNKFS